jgi:hypothetical protein
MTKLNKKYVIGTHVMFFEIEMYKDFIDGMINLLETIENKENVTIDLCLNLSQHLETIDRNQITESDILAKFNKGIIRIEELGFDVVSKVHTDIDGFYFHTDYRRDLNYNYCKKVDYVMHGETDSFFPKEALQALESLSQYTTENNIHRYAVCFADRKMWDSSWDPTVHPKYINHTFEDGPEANLNPNQAKSRMSIEDMNKINSEVDDFDFTYINSPKIDGSCLVLSADLIKFGVNVPSCLIYNDDNGLAIMAEKLLGQNYIQFICKNLLKVHARRHPLKRLYVLDEISDTHTGNLNKSSAYDEFRKLSDANIQTLASSSPNKFYEYKDFKND